MFFLKKDISFKDFNAKTLEAFSKLDDYDVVSAMKEWQLHNDFVLSNLCQMIIDRNLLKVKIKKNPFKQVSLNKQIKIFIDKFKVSEAEAKYFVFSGEISNQAYEPKNKKINILYKSGKIENIVKASDQLNLKPLSKTVTKYYICYPKETV